MRQPIPPKTRQTDDEVFLIDIRLSPRSDIPGWSQTSLRHCYHNRYQWFGPTLGNRNYDHDDQPAIIVDLETGLLDLQALLLEGHTLLLFCECSRYWDCHRQTIATRLVQTWSAFEIVLPEQVKAKRMILERLREERQTLENGINEERPVIWQHWSEIDYEHGFWG